MACALRGLANYHDCNEKFNIDPGRFSNLLDALRSMQLIVHECLQYAADERQQFLAFSKWLKLQFDVQASNLGGDSDEFSEQQASIDYPKVLAYIEGALENPKLAFFWKHFDGANQAYDMSEEEVAEALEQVRGKKIAPEDAEVPFMFFCARLGRRVKDVTTSIGERQQQMVWMPGGLVLEDDQSYSALDMRMIFEASARICTV